MQNVQIDLETMGPNPDGAIVTIAAVEFDLTTRKMGREFYRKVALATSVKLGMRIDAGTVIWWLGQSEKARDEIRMGGLPIEYVLDEFTAWAPKNMHPWGNSASFDCGILSTAYKLSGKPQPWFWSRERCFRTWHNTFAHIHKYDPKNKTGVAHNALDDCKFQIEHVWRVLEAGR